MMSRVRLIVLLVCSAGLIAGLVTLGFERAEYQREWSVRSRPWKVTVEDAAYFEAHNEGDAWKRSARFSALQAHRDALKILGWPPTQQSVERLYTYDVPGWSWWDRAENRRNRLILQAQALLRPASGGATLHVNAARDTAVVESNSRLVLIRADISGLRETTLLPAAVVDRLDRTPPAPAR
jgi:hypothetical protein